VLNAERKKENKMRKIKELLHRIGIHFYMITIEKGNYSMEGGIISAPGEKRMCELCPKTKYFYVK
jgi:hypothetical protein